MSSYTTTESRSQKTKAQQKPPVRTKTQSTLNNKRETAIAKKGVAGAGEGVLARPRKSFIIEQTKCQRQFKGPPTVRVVVSGDTGSV